MVEKKHAKGDRRPKKPPPGAQEQFRRLANRVTQGIVVLRDGKILFANDALGEMLGMANGEELQGKKQEVLVPPKELQRVRDSQQALLGRKEFSFRQK